MALEQIKEWNDSASPREITELAKTPNKRIVVIGREAHLLAPLAHSICAFAEGGYVLQTTKGEIILCNGSKVLFTTVRNVWMGWLRGTLGLDVAYLVDSYSWQIIEQDTVRCELAPLFGRKA